MGREDRAAKRKSRRNLGRKKLPRHVREGLAQRLRDWLLHYRTDRSMKPADLVARLEHLAGVKYNTRTARRWVSKRGEPVSPDLPALVAICDATGLSPSYLLLGKGPRYAADLSSSANSQTWESGLSKPLREHIRSQLAVRQGYGTDFLQEFFKNEPDPVEVLVGMYEVLIKFEEVARYAFKFSHKETVEFRRYIRLGLFRRSLSDGSTEQVQRLDDGSEYAVPLKK